MSGKFKNKVSESNIYTFHTKLFWRNNIFFYNYTANADIVTNVHAVVIASNKTLPEVNVSWIPPVNPNGFVVAYNVHYSRVDDTVQVITSI